MTLNSEDYSVRVQGVFWDRTLLIGIRYRFTWSQTQNLAIWRQRMDSCLPLPSWPGFLHAAASLQPGCTGRMAGGIDVHGCRCACMRDARRTHHTGGAAAGPGLQPGRRHVQVPPPLLLLRQQARVPGVMAVVRAFSRSPYIICVCVCERGGRGGFSKPVSYFCTEAELTSEFDVSIRLG